MLSLSHIFSQQVQVFEFSGWETGKLAMGIDGKSSEMELERKFCRVSLAPLTEAFWYQRRKEGDKGGN